jgi:LytS/YehU family sensor histidine kinase
MLLCIGTFVVMTDGVNLSKIFYSFIINFVLVLFITWFDYLVLEKIKSLMPRYPVTSLVLSIGITFLVLLLVALLLKLFVVPMFLPYIRVPTARVVVGSFFTNSMILMVIEMYSSYHIKQEAERRAIEAEREKAQYQFLALKNQINPHFLFNSMNVLSSLVYQDADKANVFTKKLSAVYRYLLVTSKRSLVSLQEEMDFVNNYIFLEKIRYADGIEVEVNGKTNLDHIHVIPASIQMLVENAIKHNKASVTAPLHIVISIQMTRVIVKNNLQLRTDINPSGIGLKNLEKQYRLQHKHIDIEVNEKEFKVTLPYFYVE